jgi:hypothetical protein
MDGGGAGILIICRSWVRAPPAPPHVTWVFVGDVVAPAFYPLRFPLQLGLSGLRARAKQEDNALNSGVWTLRLSLHGSPLASAC